LRNRRQEGKALFRVSFDDQSKGGFLRIQLGNPLRGNVSGEVSPKRENSALKGDLAIRRSVDGELFVPRHQTPG
jgi:hypothetical protein